KVGAWRGGSAVFIRAVLNFFGSNKYLFMAEPPFSPEEPPCNYKSRETDFLSFNPDTIRQTLADFQISDKVEFVSTGREPRQLALLLIDSHSYESTYNTLLRFYAKLQKGAWVIISGSLFLSEKAAL